MPLLFVKVDRWTVTLKVPEAASSVKGFTQAIRMKFSWKSIWVPLASLAIIGAVGFEILAHLLRPHCDREEKALATGADRSCPASKLAPGLGRP
jgi:hypothetical protein